MMQRPFGYFCSGFLALGLVPMTAVIIPLYALSIGASPGQVGIIMAMRSLLPFLIAIPGGAMMDRYGVRFMVTRLSLACAVLALIYPFTSTFWELVLLQLVFGLCQSFCWIGVQTGIGKTYRGDPIVTSHLGFWSMGGTFAGPFMIGFVWDYFGATASFVVTAIWCLSLMILARQLSEETASAGTRSESKRKAYGGDYLAAFALLRDPIVFYIISCSAVRLGAVALQTSFLPVYLSDLNFAASQIGILIGVSAISSACSSFLHGVLVKWWTPERILGVFILGALVAVSSISFSQSYAVLLVLNIVMGMAIGVTQPAMFSVLGARISKETQGLIVGLRTSLNRLATFLIPLGAGLTAEILGIQASFVVVGLVLFCVMSFTLIRAKFR